MQQGSYFVVKKLVEQTSLNIAISSFAASCVFKNNRPVILTFSCAFYAARIHITICRHKKCALVQKHVHHRVSPALRNKPPLKVSGPTGIRYRQLKSGYTRTPITSSAHSCTKTHIDHTVKMSDVVGASLGASI